MRTLVIGGVAAGTKAAVKTEKRRPQRRGDTDNKK